MAIELPRLDDKTYDDLVDEARMALPAIYPGWTDHNPADPGIALIELLAWLTEMIVYRTGRIPERHERGFLKLLSGGAHGGEADLEVATEATLRSLRERYRAVTPDDYEDLTALAWPASPRALALEQAAAGSSKIARSHCIAERDVSAANKLAAAPGHISLVLLPGAGSDPWLAPAAALLQAVTQFFSERRLITTQLHVAGATPVPLTISATIYLRDDAPGGGASVREAIKAALAARFHPWTGGPSGSGWPFGRAIDLSDVYAVIDDVRGVEFVEDVGLAAPGDRTLRDKDNRLLGLRIEAHELPRIDPAAVTLALRERRGGVWVTIA
jgi:hypothetical protein